MAMMEEGNLLVGGWVGGVGGGGVVRVSDRQTDRRGHNVLLDPVSCRISSLENYGLLGDGLVLLDAVVSVVHANAQHLVAEEAVCVDGMAERRLNIWLRCWLLFLTPKRWHGSNRINSGAQEERFRCSTP